jgi:hypothetical protein
MQYRYRCRYWYSVRYVNRNCHVARFFSHLILKLETDPTLNWHSFLDSYALITGSYLRVVYYVINLDFKCAGNVGEPLNISRAKIREFSYSDLLLDLGLLPNAL